jgi:hypothetical protein
MAGKDGEFVELIIDNRAAIRDAPIGKKHAMLSISKSDQ